MKRAIGLLTGLALAGCSMTPPYERPAAPVPPAFPAGSDTYPAASGAEAPPALDRALIFQDSRLQALMTQALANNRDLRVAAANILRARALVRVQRAAQLPELDAAGGISRVENVATSATNATANLSVPSFEIDLFGRLAAMTEAAKESYFQSEAAARATRLALIGDIAATWLDYAADSSLLALAQSTADSARKTVTLTDARLKGGVAPRTDLAQAQTILATAESDVARQKTLVAQDLNALTLLVGAPVDPANLPVSIEAAAQTIGDPPAGTDSAILLRRPDVLGAEYALRAGNADIGAARAALFPKITIAGLIGLASGSLESLFGNGGTSVLQGSGSASYPIFRAGAGRANVAATQAQRDALLASYEKAIQTAFREVADALARRGTMDAQLAADSRRQAAAQDVFTLSDARYKGGVDSFLDNLDAQRSLYTAQRTVVATRLEAAQNRVTLYRTLGGDALASAPDEPGAR